jgi:hypothetical protein
MELLLRSREVHVRLLEPERLSSQIFRGFTLPLKINTRVVGSSQITRQPLPSTSLLIRQLIILPLDSINSELMNAVLRKSKINNKLGHVYRP